MTPPIRLLLFEDNPGDARLVKESLAEAGAAWFELAAVTHLAGGLAHLASHAVDVILLDLTLPDSAGFDTFKRVHAQAAHIPIILLTGMQDENLAAEAVREGAQDYLIKGRADGDLLARAIRYGIERKRVEQALQENEKKVQRLLEQQIAANQLSLALGESLKLEDVYHTICAHLRKLVDVWCFIISFYDDQTGLIRAEYAESDEVYDVSQFPPIPLEETGKGTQSRVIYTGQLLYTPDHQTAVAQSKARYTIENDGSVHPELPSEKDSPDATRSAVYLPMKVRGKTIGVMQVQSRRLDAYSVEDIDLLGGMANVAAVAIQNTRLHEDVLRELTERKRIEQAILLMSDTQRQIAAQEDAGAIFQLVGEKIHQLVGEGYVSISRLDEKLQAVKLAGMFGLGSLYTDLVRIFKMDPSKLAYPIKDMTDEELRLFRSGRLEKFTGGLYSLLTRKIPQFICDAAEKQLKISGIYTMGFVAQSIHYGGLTVLAKGDIAPYQEMIETIMNQATISLKRIRAEESLRQSNEELARLYRASGSLLSGASLGLQDLAQAIIAVVQQEFGQANCSLLILNRDSNNLQRLAVAGPYAAQVKDKVLSLEGAGLAPRAIRTGKVLNVGNVRAMPNYIPNWEAAQSELTVPLLIGGKAIGAIDIQSAKPDAFSDNDERLMANFAERAALAIAHSRMYEQTQARVQQLAALRTIDMAISSSFDINLTLGILLDKLREQLGIHAADILVYNASAQTLRYSCGKGFRTQALQHTRLRLGEGLAGRAALEGRPFKIADLHAEPTVFNRSPLLQGENFTAYMGVPLFAKGQIKGVLEVLQREPLNLTPEEQSLLEMLAGQAAIAIDNYEMFDHLQSSVVDLNTAYDSTLEGWSRALDLRDKETEGHTLRVAEMTGRLAQAMGLADAELVHIRRGALLHDIGKIAVPDAILFKPGKLNDAEWAIMRQHPQLAYDMLSPIAYLHAALDIPYAHHERWDGSGYPRGLRAEQIPLAARIFAVIDVWDGIISARPYHPAQPDAVALEYIRSSAGAHLDPRVVTAFLGLER